MTSRKKKEVTLEQAVAKLEKVYGKSRSAWPDHLAFLVKEVEGLREEVGDYGRTLDRMRELLTGVAVALKGPEPELVAHDWADLPAFADALMAKLKTYKDFDAAGLYAQFREDWESKLR
jgi:hypothetical protein